MPFYGLWPRKMSHKNVIVVCLYGVFFVTLQPKTTYWHPPLFVKTIVAMDNELSVNMPD